MLSHFSVSVAFGFHASTSLSASKEMAGKKSSKLKGMQAWRKVLAAPKPTISILRFSNLRLACASVCHTLPSLATCAYFVYRYLKMPPKKKVERPATENISLGPQVREGAYDGHPQTALADPLS